MRERIVTFLESEKISSAEFADKIGVQRSSVSHILNGRNFPSASFIQKMLLSFPNLNSRWLMIGTGAMKESPNDLPKSPEIAANEGLIGKTGDILHADLHASLPYFVNAEDEVALKALQTPSKSQEGLFQPAIDTVPSAPNKEAKTSPNISASDAIRQDARSDNPEKSHQSHHQTTPFDEGIEQIVVFYKDKTFKAYRPF